MTTNEIARLKRDWLADPIYDLEDAAGFEAHREELAAFRRDQEAEWLKEGHERLCRKAEALGCPGNIKLAGYINGLERQIDRLESAMIEARLIPECRP